MAEKMNLKESVVRSYIWKMKNPEKYKKLVKRWCYKRKTKAESEKSKEEEFTFNCDRGFNFPFSFTGITSFRFP
jgi:hypothetical protein